MSVCSVNSADALIEVTSAASYVYARKLQTHYSHNHTKINMGNGSASLRQQMDTRAQFRKLEMELKVQMLSLERDKSDVQRRLNRAVNCGQEDLAAVLARKLARVDNMLLERHGRASMCR
jgi:hypothetical protein